MSKVEMVGTVDGVKMANRVVRVPEVEMRQNITMRLLVWPYLNAL
jgi:hypothetical protein